MSADSYESPLITRYATPEMGSIFSARNKYRLWRRLWLALAQEQQRLGMPIQESQIQELESHLDTIDFKVVEAYEARLHHDVMAHLHAYGDQCPTAKAILHLGATSAFVTDNGDLLQFQTALQLIQSKLKEFLKTLSEFCQHYATLPCLGYTHFQPAQLTTVGKRAALWLQDFVTDLTEVTYRLDHLQFLGMKGATGTQASLVALFDGDLARVEALERGVAKRMGFQNVYPLAGQTYSRKQDSGILHALAGIGESAHKCATDLRLLAHLGEVEESFGEEQVGSSAMPYKRNPILAERVCSLSRLLINQEPNARFTTATQWLERSLDDSAGRRLYMPEAFLLADAILVLLSSIFQKIQVNPYMIAKNLSDEFPFLITENVLMLAVKKGGDRQQLHEALRRYAQHERREIKAGRPDNHLIAVLKKDPLFAFTDLEWQELLDPKRYVGMAPQQVEAFITETGLTITIDRLQT